VQSLFVKNSPQTKLRVLKGTMCCKGVVPVKNSELKILFIDITKTAGTAISASFADKFPNYEFEGKHHSIQNFIAHGSNLVDDEGQPHRGTCSLVTQDDLDNFHTFSVIRNPYDRMVSLWLWGCQTIYGHNFDLFVNDVATNKYQDYNRVRYRSQVEWISDTNGTIKVPHLLRYEALKQDFTALLNRVGITPFPLLVRNTAAERSNKKRKSMAEYYTNKHTRQTVEKLWADDFQYFNYEKL